MAAVAPAPEPEVPEQLTSPKAVFYKWMGARAGLAEKGLALIEQHYHAEVEICGHC